MSTEVANVCRIFKDDSAVVPILICDEGELMSRIKDVKLVADLEVRSFFDIKTAKPQFRQLFLRDIDELNYFNDRAFATIYLPDSGINFDDEGKLNSQEATDWLIKRRCVLNSFAMYNGDVVSKQTYDKYETLDSYLYKLEGNKKDEEE